MQLTAIELAFDCDGGPIAFQIDKVRHAFVDTGIYCAGGVTELVGLDVNYLPGAASMAVCIIKEVDCLEGGFRRWVWDLVVYAGIRALAVP